MFEPCCQMKVDEYGFFITWKSEGKVPSTIFYHSSLVYSLSHKKLYPLTSLFLRCGPFQQMLLCIKINNEAKWADVVPFVLYTCWVVLQGGDAVWGLNSQSEPVDVKTAKLTAIYKQVQKNIIFLLIACNKSCHQVLQAVVLPTEY